MDDVIVIADYYTWYERPSDPGNHWYNDEGQRVHIYDPLLGEYASGDPIVISKHIDWATGHGIDAFSVSWWTTGKDERTWDYHNTRNFESFLQNPLINQMKFCILYEDLGRLRSKITYEYDPVRGTLVVPIDEPYNKNRLISDFKFLAENYFNHPQYLKIGGKYFVQFDVDRHWIGDIESVIRDLRDEMEKEGYELYLVGNILGWYFPDAPYDALEPRNRQIVRSMDAISAHINMWNYGNEEARKNFPNFVKNLYDRWYSYATRFNPEIDLIPNIMPGQESHPLVVTDPYYVPLKRSPELLRDLAQLAFDYTGRKRRIWKVSAFNEWSAGLQIEPSTEDNFIYLQTLKETLESSK